MKENWTYKKLGEVATHVTDGDWIESKDQSESGIRLIQTGNVGNGVFKSKEAKTHYISEETFSRIGCNEIFEGDCLISRLPDPIGRACIIPNVGCRMITAVDCSIIRFGDNYIPQFFVYYTQSLKYRIGITNNTTGSTRKRISIKNLEKVLIPIPSLS
jgi:type I restriction enzyme S subunit